MFNIILENGTVYKVTATTGNEAMNKAIREHHICYEDIKKVIPIH